MTSRLVLTVSFVLFTAQCVNRCLSCACLLLVKFLMVHIGLRRCVPSVIKSALIELTWLPVSRLQVNFPLLLQLGPELSRKHRGLGSVNSGVLNLSLVIGIRPPIKLATYNVLSLYLLIGRVHCITGMVTWSLLSSGAMLL